MLLHLLLSNSAPCRFDVSYLGDWTLPTPRCTIDNGNTGFSPACSSITLSLATPRPLHKFKRLEPRTEEIPGYANLKLPTERIPDYANSKLPNPSDKWISQQLEWFNLVLQLVDFQFNDFKPLVFTFSVDSHFQIGTDNSRQANSRIRHCSFKLLQFHVITTFGYDTFLTLIS